jgi:lipoate-protein ligase B
MTLISTPPDPVPQSGQTAAMECEGAGSPGRRRARLWIAGIVPYAPAWALQQRLAEKRLIGRSLDTVMFMEHEPTFTMGRRSLPAHWGGDEAELKRSGCAVYRVERGGSVTYHGPGQVVGYPILDIRDYCAGPKGYMNKLEAILIRTLSVWGIQGFRRAGYPGVWVGDEPAKIAAMGTHIRRGVSMHGFALNVTVDLGPFHVIVPCGLEGCRVTSMAELLGRSLELDIVKDQLAEAFAQEFELNWSERRRIEVDRLLQQETQHD